MKVLNYPLTKDPFKYIFLMFFVLLSLFSNQYSFAQTKAFPSAYGAGAYTSGGRGGIVVHVTNLNDKGRGSFREALLMTVPRTIVFDVSGVITLSSYVQMRAENSNVTIAGQTSPEGGITIDGNRLYLTHVDNIIVRYIRFRGGITAKGLGYDMNDSLSALGNITNQIFDHCSFSWDGDESASWYTHLNFDKVTVQRSIFGEGQEGSLFGGTEKAKMGEITMHHSLFYNVTHRTPNVSGWNGAKIETINNVVWTVSHRLVRSSGNLNWNHIGNYYDYGNTEINNGVLHMHHAIDKTPPKIYTHGNKIVAVNSNTSRGLTPVNELNSDNRKSHRYFQNAQGNKIGEQLKANYFTNRQHPLLGNPIPIQSADAAFLSVKSDVGCNARLNGDGSVSDNKDVLDAKWLDNVNKGKYVKRSHNSTWKVPKINSIKRSNDFYKSNPHIPEAFFRAHVPKGQDHNNIAPSGYTWLEEYLNGVDGSSKSAVAVRSIELTPKSAELEITEKLQLSKTFNPGNATNQKGSWKSNNDKIATVDSNGLVTPVSYGEVTIIFKSSDGQHEGKSDITVLRVANVTANAGEDQGICEGTRVTLTATGGSFYLWSTGAKTKSITVSPNQTTTYKVTAYDNTRKNSDSDEVRVTVSPLPIIDAGKNITIESGDRTTLKATGATSYRWSTGGTNASINVSPTATTTYTVTGTTNGCEATDTVTVTVRNSTSAVGEVSAGADQTICKYSSTTLTATGGSTYIWSTGENTESIEVSPNKTTIYSVTAYDSKGKNAGSDQVKVTSSPWSNVGAGNNVTINLGEVTTLTATGASTYLWSNGATTASIDVSPEFSKLYTVTGTTIHGCEGTNSVLVMIRNTVYDPDQAGEDDDQNGIHNDQVSAGEDQSICKYTSTSLTATGGVDYLWSTGERTATIYVSPKETTDYSVTAYDSSAEEIGSDESRVTVIEMPYVSAGKNVTMNLGESTTLTATGASTYLWSNGATTASINVSPDSTTYYSVIGTTAEGCDATNRVLVMLRNTSYYVDVNNGIVLSKETNRSGSVKSSAKVSVNTYSGDNSDILDLNADGNNFVKVGYSNVSGSKIVQDETVNLVASRTKSFSIDDVQTGKDAFTFEFLIHPNPTSGQLHIKISGLTDLSSIQLYDLSGKSLYNEAINSHGQKSYTKTLNLSDYTSGVYFLQLVDKERVITKKVVLK